MVCPVEDFKGQSFGRVCPVERYLYNYLYFLFNMECVNFKTYYYDKIVLENHSIYETLGVITLFLRTGKKTQDQFIYQTMRHF